MYYHSACRAFLELYVGGLVKPIQHVELFLVALDQKLQDNLYWAVNVVLGCLALAQEL